MQNDWILDQGSSHASIVEALHRHGVAIIPNALDQISLKTLYSDLTAHFASSSFSQGLFYGNRTKRFGRVLSRSKLAQSLALNELALGASKSILGHRCHELQLNLTQAIEIWPGSYAQVPHRDHDIWFGADCGGEKMLNAMWALDDFTSENGATLVWPGSHRTPDVVIPEAPGVPATMPRGSLCLFLGSTLHAGGPNWSTKPRRGLVISYCLGWLKPCENPWLSYPPEVASGFSAELARLVGYRQDAPSLNNVDGSCPSRMLRSHEIAPVFADQLSPMQTALIQTYNEGQLAAIKRAA
jgi:ectoine hydroxylase-related dioxygenase (phytanoyl-CoA dioxygenase family)